MSPKFGRLPTCGDNFILNLAKLIPLTIHEPGQKSWGGGGEGSKENFRCGESKNFMKFYSRFVKIWRVVQKMPFFLPNFPIFGPKIFFQVGDIG